MEKRAILAIALSFLVLWIWTTLVQKQEPVPRPQPEVDEERSGAVRPAERRPVEPAPSTESGPDPGATPAFAPAIAATNEERVEARTSFVEVALTNRGGRALSWKLQGYDLGEAQGLELVPRFDDDRYLPLAIELDDESLTEQLNQALYEVERKPVRSERDGPGERIRFAWSDGLGLEARKTFTFYEEGWLVDVELEVVDRGRRLPARLALGPGFAAQEAGDGKSSYYYSGQGVWDLAGRVTRRKPQKLGSENGEVSGDLRWAGLEDQYFAALILPSASQSRAKWRSIELTRLPPELPGEKDEEAASVRLAIFSVSVPETGARLYVGPKSYRLLRSLGGELEKAVWFATNPFLAWISKQIFFALIWIHSHITGNYGLAIILATLFLRTLLFPVNQYSMVNMKKTQLQMQRLQPKIKAIKAKYKKSKDAQARAKMNQETMDLYKREGVNPMGGVSGCLPLLAQFPILIGFYNMLTVAVELRGAPFFGWIQDLTQKDPYYVTPLLMAVTMFAQQRLATSKVKDPMQAQQQKMMMFMPIIFGYICIQMPAGLVLYWFVNNLLGIGQQWLVNRHTGRLEAAAQKA